MATAQAEMKARYFTADGESAGERELPAEPFDGVVHEASIYTVVKAYLANQRQGTAAAKSRGEVRGGGRKPWRQKGTGRARHGTIRSPIWRGGAVTFPPIPRSYRERPPRKVKALARRSAFNARAADDRVLLLEDLTFDAPKTRRLKALLEKLGVGDGHVLILTSGHRPEVHLSGRNIPTVEVRPWGTESVYDVLRADFVVIETGALSVSEPDAAEPEESEPEESEPEATTESEATKPEADDDA